MSKQLEVTEAEYVAVVNEWWRLYVDEPSRFAAIIDEVKEVLEAENEDREPTTGERDLAFFKHLLAQYKREGFERQRLPEMPKPKPQRKAKPKAKARRTKR